MSPVVVVLLAFLGYGGFVVAVAVGIGYGIRLADQAESTDQ